MRKSMRQQIYSLEKRLLEPEVRKNPDELAKLIADDFVEYGSTGCVYNKQDILKVLPQAPARRMGIENFDARHLSPEVVISSYSVVPRDKRSGGDERSTRNSIWKMTDGRWQIVFHKGKRP